MIVADVMNRHVEFVSADTPVIDVASLIFGRGINGVPVVEKTKLVGFITERDILSKFFPTVDEYIEDPFREGDFEGMEKKVEEIFKLKVKEIMTKDPVSIKETTPLLRAQSLMFLHKVGRLPVLDEKDNLVGILSKGDIFRAVVGEKISLEAADEKFHDWLSRRFDLITNQDKRLTREIPDLVNLFRKEKVKNVLDVGSGTGVHSIALAKEGFNVVGIDRSKRMNFVSNEKAKSLPAAVLKRLQFVHSEYKNLDKIFNKKFDAAIFMGSGLAHNPNPQQVLTEVNKVLAKHAVIVCQIANYEKVLKANRRLYDFNIRKSQYRGEEEQAFLRFFDPLDKGFLTQNVSVFAKGKGKWDFRGMHSVSIMPLDKNKLTNFLKNIKFSDIALFGGEEGYYYDYLFQKPFKPLESDVLVVVAKR